MNVAFVTVLQFKHLKGLAYLQANYDFQKIITQAWKNIFSCGLLHLVHLNEIFENKLINIRDFLVVHLSAAVAQSLSLGNIFSSMFYYYYYSGELFKQAIYSILRGGGTPGLNRKK